MQQEDLQLLYRAGESQRIYKHFDLRDSLDPVAEGALVSESGLELVIASTVLNF